MSNDTIIDTLEKLAMDQPIRSDFNFGVKKTFGKMLGSGQFRLVYGAGDTVIKIRRASPKDFPMHKIDHSNSDEVEAYSRFVNNFPIHAMLVLKPTYVSLDNDHDAVLMDRCDRVWANVPNQSDYAKANPLIHNQIQMIQGTFQDSHDGNIGILGNRAYLIDFNFYQTWDGAPSEAAIKRVLRAVGIKFPYGKRKPKLQALQACA